MRLTPQDLLCLQPNLFGLGKGLRFVRAHLTAAVGPRADAMKRDRPAKRDPGSQPRNLSGQKNDLRGTVPPLQSSALRTGKVRGPVAAAKLGAHLNTATGPRLGEPQHASPRIGLPERSRHCLAG